MTKFILIGMLAVQLFFLEVTNAAQNPDQGGVFKMENNVYKILTEEQWRTASETGLIEVELDKKDGFIHLSTASQLAGTLSFYFADDEDLILLQLDRSQIKDALIYEAPFPVGDRTGEFPHLYSELSVDQVAQVWKISRGAFSLPKEIILQAESF